MSNELLIGCYLAVGTFFFILWGLNCLRLNILSPAAFITGLALSLTWPLAVLAEVVVLLESRNDKKVP